MSRLTLCKCQEATGRTGEHPLIDFDVLRRGSGAHVTLGVTNDLGSGMPNPLGMLRTIRRSLALRVGHSCEF